VLPLDLDVRNGEFLTLLGPSGCGKTTTLRMIAGFVRPSTGHIVVDGDDITDLPPQKRNMGMVFQDYSLFPHLTIADNIAFALVERRVPSAERARRVKELLELTRLPQIAQRFPSELSGGQQQRVALARALAHTPRVLLMDEPFGALDAKLREAMQEELRTIQSSLRITTLFVTHDQSEAMRLSDRIAVMNHGRIEQLDEPRTLYDAPRTRFVADFVGKINFVAASVVGSDSGRDTLAVDALGSRFMVRSSVPALVGQQVTLAIRPERIRLAAAAPAADGMIEVEALIERVAFLGNVMHTELRAGETPLVMESAPGDWSVGARLRVCFQSSDASVLAESA